jgi:peroxiredoxin
METGKTPAVGDTAPEFALPDSTGAMRRLSELCATGACLVFFYRGHW